MGSSSQNSAFNFSGAVSLQRSAECALRPPARSHCARPPFRAEGRKPRAAEPQKSEAPTSTRHLPISCRELWQKRVGCGRLKSATLRADESTSHPFFLLVPSRSVRKVFSVSPHVSKVRVSETSTEKSAIQKWRRPRDVPASACGARFSGALAPPISHFSPGSFAKATVRMSGFANPAVPQPSSDAWTCSATFDLPNYPCGLPSSLPSPLQLGEVLVAEGVPLDPLLLESLPGSENTGGGTSMRTAASAKELAIGSCQAVSSACCHCALRARASFFLTLG